MSTVFSITNTTIGASRQRTISDADTTRILNWYKARVLTASQQSMTNGQIAQKLIDDFVARLVDQTQRYELEIAAPSPITVT